MTYPTEKTRAFMAQVQATLAAKGIEVVDTANQTLRGELTAHGKAIAIVHILCAEAYFSECSSLTRRECRAFWNYLYEEVDADRTESKGKDVYLLVVGTDEFIYDPARLTLFAELQLDSNLVKKYAFGLSELAAWVGNPFEPWKHFAKGPATGHFVPETRREWKPPLPENTATLAFVPSECPELFRTLSSRPDREVIQSLAGHLVRRIAGLDYCVGWEEGWPQVGRFGQSKLLPFAYLSSGEKLLVALCTFLAMAHASPTREKLGLGIPSVLTGLDSVRRFAVMECLRDFVLATGASVYLQASTDQVLRLAESKIANAIKLVNASQST